MSTTDKSDHNNLLPNKDSALGEQKDIEKLNKMCLSEQRNTWNRTNEIIVNNHEIVSNDLHKAKMLRKALEDKIITKNANIQSIKHIDEFMLRKVRLFKRYHNANYYMDYGSVDDNANRFIVDKSKKCYNYFDVSQSSTQKYKKNVKFRIDGPNISDSKLKAMTVEKKPKIIMPNFSQQEPTVWMRNCKQAKLIKQEHEMALVKIEQEREQEKNMKIEQNKYIKFQENIKRLKVQNNLKERLTKYSKTFIEKLDIEKSIISEKLKTLDKMNRYSMDIDERLDQTKKFVENQEINQKLKSNLSHYSGRPYDSLVRPVSTNDLLDVGYFERNTEIPEFKKISNQQKLKLQSRPIFSSHGPHKKNEKSVSKDLEQSNVNSEKKIFKKFYIDKFVDPNFRVGRGSQNEKIIKNYRQNTGLLPAYE